MASNDDVKQHGEEATQSSAFSDEPVASVLLDDHTAGVDETSTYNPGSNEATSARSSSDHSMLEDFTFFQKKKRADQTNLASSLAYASTAQVTAFAAQLDSAVAVNAKTQRHIAELMELMSDVAHTVTTDFSEPKRKKLRRSKWLFYGCLAGFGVGWFLLFPSGHNLITQLAAFFAR